MSEAGNFGVTGPLFSNSSWMNEAWIEVSYAKHRIRPWCREESCYLCNENATHKVGECDMLFGHPYTAYVCCEHFFGCSR